MTYRIKLDVFEGPFDLLLHLIKINEMDIYDIKISEITKQYLDYIRLMEQLDLEIAGEYLVMAATLINIKSRTLLPVQEGESVEDEIDEIMSTKELIRQLVEYRKYKELAQSLRIKESQNINLFYRTNIIPIFPHLNEEEDVVKEDIKKLFDAFSRVIGFVDKKHFHRISMEEYSVEDKITLLRTQFESSEQVILNKLFENCVNKAEIIVTFLASLELVRLKEVKILQSGPYKEIFLMKRKLEDEPAIVIPQEEIYPQGGKTQAVDAPSDESSAAEIIEIKPFDSSKEILSSDKTTLENSTIEDIDTKTSDDEN